jgi:hypothetical protein
MKLNRLFEGILREGGDPFYEAARQAHEAIMSIFKDLDCDAQAMADEFVEEVMTRYCGDPRVFDDD